MELRCGKLYLLKADSEKDALEWCEAIQAARAEAAPAPDVLRKGWLRVKEAGLGNLLAQAMGKQGWKVGTIHTLSMVPIQVCMVP